MKGNETMNEPKFLVRAILIDETGPITIETITDSYRTDDYEPVLEWTMKRHCVIYNSYRYIVTDLATGENIVDTRQNKYYDEMMDGLRRLTGSVS